MALVGDVFDKVAESFSHVFRQADAVGIFQNVGDAALAGLAVDADDVRFIFSADVFRVERQVGDIPVVVHAFGVVLHAFGDGVLMRAGEGGKDELAGVGLAVADLHAGEALVHLDELRHVGEVQMRINAVGVHVHGDGDDVDVARAFAIAEERAFDAVGSGEKSHLGIRHA